METILYKILAEKTREVAILKEKIIAVSKPDRPRRSFIQKLKEASDVCIIAEFKRASPSKGIINDRLDPVEQARRYEKQGAAAISVLTDASFFKGSFEDLKAISAAVNLPILCKDFIVDEIQIDLALEAGADMILLIAAALDQQRLGELYKYAQSAGLEVLVEIHDEEELEKAINAGADLIGVNNRDLRTFEVSLEATKVLGPKVRRSGAFLISESGMKCGEDISTAAAAGANGVLIGESFMASGNLEASFTHFRVPLMAGEKI